jgi:hypothetical protein
VAQHLNKKGLFLLSDTPCGYSGDFAALKVASPSEPNCIKVSIP